MTRIKEVLATYFSNVYFGMCYSQALGFVKSEQYTSIAAAYRSALEQFNHNFTRDYKRIMNAVRENYNRYAEQVSVVNWPEFLAQGILPREEFHEVYASAQTRDAVVKRIIVISINEFTNFALAQTTEATKKDFREDDMASIQRQEMNRAWKNHLLDIIDENCRVYAESLYAKRTGVKERENTVPRETLQAALAELRSTRAHVDSLKQTVKSLLAHIQKLQSSALPEAEAPEPEAPEPEAPEPEAPEAPEAPEPETSEHSEHSEQQITPQTESSQLQQTVKIVPEAHEFVAEPQVFEYTESDSDASVSEDTSSEEFLTGMD